MTLRPDSSGMEVHAGSRYSSAYQLNPLWERVVRTQKLPPEVDLQEVRLALKHRLRDPEKEVRQHALRVLVDLVPVLHASLDSLLTPLLPDLLQNLGHPAPAVRKGSLDALRMYVLHSDNKQPIISEICTKCLVKNCINDKHQEDVTMGVILALPSLLQTALGYSENSSSLNGTVIKALSSKLFQMVYQEAAMRSLVAIRDLLGKKAFEDLMANLDPGVTENFNLLCDVYDLPKPTEIEPEIILNNNDSDSLGNEKTDELFISEPPTQLLESENTGPDFQQTFTVDVDKTDAVPNGKVILETEIAFDSQTAITMTILEEDENGLNGPPESEDDTFDYTTYNKSVVKVLTDSEVEEYEEVRRTPRRVRFGGEIVKMRTPDSDTIQNSDADEIIEITKNSNKTEQIQVVKPNNKVQENTKTDNSKDTGSSDEKLLAPKQPDENKDSLSVVNVPKSQKSLIPVPVEPITSRPKVRKSTKVSDSISSESKIKSKSLNDLSTYCKQHFGSTSVVKYQPQEDTIKKLSEKTRRSFIPLKSFSKDDIRIEEIGEFAKSPRFVSIMPLDEPIHSNLFQAESKSYLQDDLGNSGNSSTGSGSSSDNTVEDTLEELSLFNDDLFKDLYKMDSQRGAFQTLERLTTRLNNNLDFGPSLDSHQVQALVTKLGKLTAKTRGRAGEAALQALRALVRTATDKTLKSSVPALAEALAGAGIRCQGLLTDVGRRIPASDLIEALLDERNSHWKSTKLRAGALRTVSYIARTLPCSGVRVSWACSRCAACARSPRRRVRAAALDALATLARLSSPRAVLTAVHREAADHADGDQLYDAVLARLCRPVAPGANPAIPAVGTHTPGHSVARRPDLAWVMAGVGDASPPPIHKLKRTGDEWIHQARGNSSIAEYGESGHLTTPLYHSRIAPSAEQWSHQEYYRKESSGPTRVLTAPPVALRPITLPAIAPPTNQSSMPTRAVLWASPAPSQIDIHWNQKQESWTPLGGSWPRQVEIRGDTWPGQVGRPHMNILSPSQQHGKWGWGQNQEMRVDGFSPHEPSPLPSLVHQTQGGPRYNTSEGPVFPRQQYPGSAILLTIHNKTEDHGKVGDQSSQKSDAPSTISVQDAAKSPTGSTASLAMSISSPNMGNKMKANGIVQPEERSNKTIFENNLTPVGSPSHSEQISLNNVVLSRKTPPNNHSPAHSNNSLTVNSFGKNGSHESSPFRNENSNIERTSSIQKPPTIDDDFDYDDDGVTVMHALEIIRPKTPSPRRFINTQESEEQIDVEEPTHNNLRFINMSEEATAPDMTDNVSVTSDKFLLKENMSRGSAHTVKSQRISSPVRDARVTPMRTVVTSAPAISYLGSSVSTEEEVKSVESGSSEHSVSSIENDNPNKAINPINNRINSISKKPLKKIGMISKPVNSKLARNRIQPSQTIISTDKPYDRPKEVLSKSLVQLESCDWETVMSGLHGMENLVKYHSVFLETHLTPVCRVISAQIKNLRSQVARAACRLAGSLFIAQKKVIESEADELAVPLLSRTADTNKFLRIDANDALDKMCDSISPHKSICILMSKGAAHQNAIVRCTSARLLGNIAKAFGADRVFGIQKEIRDKLIQTGADLLTEGSLETRGHAKQLFKVLSQNPNFLRILRDTIPLSKYRSIEKALNNIRAQ